MNVSIFFRVLLILSALGGVWGGGELSLNHLHTGDSCPTLGPIPACMLVFVGYAAIVISALLPKAWLTRLFFIGWTPVFGLAFVGAVTHTFIGDICPVSVNGIPQCYVSFGLSIVVLTFALLAKRSK